MIGTRVNVRVRVAMLAGLTLALSGCFWPAPGAGPDRRAHNVFEDRITPESVADLEEVWTTSLGQGSVGTPIVSNHRVHVVADHHMYGLNRITGAEDWVWTPESSDPTLRTSAAIFDGDVLWAGWGLPFPEPDYETLWLDPATGEEVGLAGPDGGLVNGVRGKRYVVSRTFEIPGDRRNSLSLTVADLDDPNVGWSGTIGRSILGCRTGECLTLGEDFVFHAGEGPISPDDPLSRGNGIRGYAIDGQPECPPENPEDLVCPSWVTPLDGGAATVPILSADGATAYTGTRPGLLAGTDTYTVYAVNTTDGTVGWSSPVDASVGSISGASGNLYVTTTDGTLRVLDASDGSELWRAAIGGGQVVQPAIAGGVVFTAAWSSGEVRAFDAAGCGAATCDPLWSVVHDSAITGGPAVSQGQLYVGLRDGRIVAYGLP